MSDFTPEIFGYPVFIIHDGVVDHLHEMPLEFVNEDHRGHRRAIEKKLERQRTERPKVRGRRIPVRNVDLEAPKVTQSHEHPIEL